MPNVIQLPKLAGWPMLLAHCPNIKTWLGLQAAVVMPYYDRKFVQENEFDTVFQATELLGSQRFYFEILKGKNR